MRSNETAAINAPAPKPARAPTNRRGTATQQTSRPVSRSDDCANKPRPNASSTGTRPRGGGGWPARVQVLGDTRPVSRYGNRVRREIRGSSFPVPFRLLGLGSGELAADVKRRGRERRAQDEPDHPEHTPEPDRHDEDGERA